MLQHEFIPSIDMWDKHVVTWSENGFHLSNSGFLLHKHKHKYMYQWELFVNNLLFMYGYGIFESTCRDCLFKEFFFKRSSFVGSAWFHPHHNGQWPPSSKDFYTCVFRKKKSFNNLRFNAQVCCVKCFGLFPIFF